MRSASGVRSPLLRATGSTIDPATPGILRRRRVAIAGVAAIGIGCVLLIRTDLMPLPAMDLLYVLHDAIALPFWGYTWTFFAPYSLAWWSLAAIALVIWLATFLTRRSAVRGLHARLNRAVIVQLVANSHAWSRHVGWLTGSIDWLAAHRLGAELLTDVVRLEYAAALTSIANANPELDERAAWRLVRLTDLLARLTSARWASPRDGW